MKLYPFQKEGVHRIWEFGGNALLADEMGLGKTVQACEYARLSPNKRPILVICPAGAKWVWEDHLKSILGMKSVILSGWIEAKTKPSKIPPITIINFENTWAWESYIKKLKCKLLIIDEGHYLKNRSSKRSKVVRRIAKTIPYKIVITATPALSRPAEIWSQANIVKRDVFPSQFHFHHRYCGATFTEHGTWDFSGASNIKELHQILTKSMMIRRLKKNILKQLPPKIRTLVPLDMERPKEYLRAKNNFLEWTEQNEGKEKADKASKAEEITKLSALRKLAAQLKMKQVLSWIKNFLENNDKLVIMGHHRIILQTIQKAYPQSVTIDGSTPMNQRKGIVHKFQNNPKVKLFIGNIKAAGTVITLTAARSLAFVEVDWVPGNMIQAEDRIYGRLDGTQSLGATIYYLIAKNSIEEQLCKLIQYKQKIMSRLLDGGDVRTEMNIYDALKKAIAKSGE